MTENRFAKSEVAKEIAAIDGNMIEAKDNLVKRFGEAYLLPLTEEEEAFKLKEKDASELQEELFEEYLAEEKEEEASGNPNNITEEILNRLNEHEKMIRKEEAERFEKDFPSYGPEVKPSQSEIAAPAVVPPLVRKWLYRIDKCREVDAFPKAVSLCWNR